MGLSDGQSSLGGFRSTNWSLIDLARDPNTAQRRWALGEFFQQYQPALRAYLVLGKHLDRNRADDILQGFFADKILTGRLLKGATPERGKLRSLLLTSLNNYLISQIRADRSRGRAFSSDNACEVYEPAADGEVDPFELAWARQLLEKTFARMRSECEAQNKEHSWRLFEARLLRPMMTDSEPVEYQELVAELGFRSAEQAGNALVTAKRMFCRHFVEVAEEYSDQFESSEELLAELMTILNRARPIDWSSIADELNLKDSPTESSALLDTSPSLIASVLEKLPDPQSNWEASDHEPILQHVLSGPAADWGLGSDPAAGTLRDVLFDPTANVAHLDAIKREARVRMLAQDKFLPTEVCNAVYFTSIASALVHRQQRITRSDDSILKFGFGTVASSAWAPPFVRDLSNQALKLLSVPRS